MSSAATGLVCDPHAASAMSRSSAPVVGFVVLRENSLRSLVFVELPIRSSFLVGIGIVRLGLLVVVGLRALVGALFGVIG